MKRFILKNKFTKYKILTQNTENLLTKHHSSVKIWSIIALVLVLTYTGGYVVASLTYRPNIVERIFHKEIMVIKNQPEPFSEKALIALIKRLHIKHKDIVLKQAKVETGNFRQWIFLENNNLFGMKYPKYRITTAIGENRGHAVYNTWQESVIDYAIYQSTYLYRVNRKEYLQYLQANYAENPEYKNLLESYFSK